MVQFYNNAISDISACRYKITSQLDDVPTVMAIQTENHLGGLNTTCNVRYSQAFEPKQYVLSTQNVRRRTTHYQAMSGALPFLTLNWEYILCRYLLSGLTYS